MAFIILTCPQCGQNYSAEIDHALVYKDVTCQRCGGKIPVSTDSQVAAFTEELRKDVDLTNRDVVGSLSYVMEQYKLGRYSKDEVIQHLKLQARILKIKAKGFERAADYCARLAEAQRAAQEARKTIHVHVTVKFENQEKDLTEPEIIDTECKEINSVSELKSFPELISDSDEQDKVSETPRNECEAERIVRDGTADESRMKFLQFYLENQDVIIGVVFCATLQFSTCLLCAALDGHRWKNPQEIHLVPKLPMHEGCRCVILPLTEMWRINSSKRPAEASDFWHDAAVRYARKYPNKRWEKLSASTKLKYYYEEQKLFEQETGRPAFDQVPQNMSFSEWLHTRPEELQIRYLGELRAKLFIEHNLNLIDFVDQTTWTLFSDDVLISKYIPLQHTERME